MKKPIVIGIASTIVLILFYFGAGLLDLINQNNQWPLQISQSSFKIFISLFLIPFYFSVSSYFKKHKKYFEVKVLNLLITLKIVTIITLLVHIVLVSMPIYTLTVLYGANIIVLTILGIKIIKGYDEVLSNIQHLKFYIISTFTATVLVLLFLIKLGENHSLNLQNIAFSIYGFPYIFMLLFFIKEKKQIQLNKTNV